MQGGRMKFLCLIDGAIPEKLRLPDKSYIYLIIAVKQPDWGQAFYLACRAPERRP